MVEIVVEIVVEVGVGVGVEVEVGVEVGVVVGVGPLSITTKGMKKHRTLIIGGLVITLLVGLLWAGFGRSAHCVTRTLA